MSDLNTKSDSKKLNTNNFESRIKNRFVLDSNELFNKNIEHSNFFEKDTSLSDDFTTIKIHFERATLREASSFKNFLDKTISEENNNIIVDLNECEFVDSSFFGALVAGVKRLNTAGKKFHLVYDSKNRLPIFSATGLDRVFSVFPSIEEAIAA